MGIMDKLPKVPKLEKFLFCMDVPTGVRNMSIGLMILWILYLIGNVATVNTTGNKAWGAIWSIASIVVYAAVLYGMRVTKKILLLPALIVSVFNFIVGILNGVINFIIFAWFSAVWLLAIAVLTAYYAIGLKNVYDDMSDAPAPTGEPVTDSKPPVNPV